MKKITCLCLSICLFLSGAISVFATTYPSDSTSERVIFCDEDNMPYEVFEDRGQLVLKSLYSPKMGGGIGRCPANKYKTFSYTISRKNAQAALRVITIGEGAVISIGTLIVGISALSSLTAGLLLNFLGGQSAYETALYSFLNSGKETGYIKLKTHCVNRGYIHGEPMYDYVVDKAYISY